MLACSASPPAVGSWPMTVPGDWGDARGTATDWNPVCASRAAASATFSPITDGTASGWYVLGSVQTGGWVPSMNFTSAMRYGGVKPFAWQLREVSMRTVTYRTMGLGKLFTGMCAVALVMN